MIVFITLKVLNDKHNQIIDGMERGYIEYFKRENIFPPQTVFIPILNDLEQIRSLIKRVTPDCIILTGGNNVQTTDGMHLNIDDVHVERDAVEKYLTEYADQHGIFKLAICRGFQFLNVHYSGKIKYFLNNHPPMQDHICLYKEQEYWVNSYHNHGVDMENLAGTLKPIVFSKQDKMVEAFINENSAISPTLGIQWHPERRQFPVDLFKIIWDKYFYESSYSSSGARLKAK